MSEKLDSKGTNHYRSHTPSPDDISLIDIAVAIARHKKTIILAPFVTALLTAFLTLFIPNTYSSSIKIMPVSGKLSREVLVSLLKSDEMGDSLVKRFMPKEPNQSASSIMLRKKLLDEFDFTLGAEGSISVNVDDSSPSRVVRLANAIPSVLGALVMSRALTEDACKRVSLQRQLPDIRKDLAEAENNLLLARKREGFVEPEARVRELVTRSAELKARIAMKELELLTMGPFDPVKSQNFVRTQQELNALWMSLNSIDADPAISAAVSGTQRTYLANVRDVVYNETRYDQMLKQIEIARLGELQNIPVIQVLGSASVPEKASAPRRGLIVIVSAAVAGFFAILWSLFSEAVSWAGKDSRNAESIRELREALKWKNG